MDEPEKHHGPYGRRYEGTDKPERSDAQKPKEKAPDKRTKDSDHEVSHQTKSVTPHQLSCKPSCRCPDDEKPKPVHIISSKGSC
jgi:hypothetical protein